MKKTIISSVVFILIVSKPFIFNMEVFAYENLKSNVKNMNRIEMIRKWDKKEDYIDETDILEDTADVDQLVSGLKSNTRRINGLLKEKKTIVEKIQEVINTRILTKTNLSEQQMDQFREFSSHCEMENEKLRLSLEKIVASNLIETKNELLHTKSNFEHICDELVTVNAYQTNAIYSLKSMISYGTKTLAVL